LSCNLRRYLGSNHLSFFFFVGVEIFFATPSKVRWTLFPRVLEFFSFRFWLMMGGVGGPLTHCSLMFFGRTPCPSCFHHGQQYNEQGFKNPLLHLNGFYGGRPGRNLTMQPSPTSFHVAPARGTDSFTFPPPLTFFRPPGLGAVPSLTSSKRAALWPKSKSDFPLWKDR